MNKILCISYSLPPMPSPRSIQVSATLRYLAKRGWDITVISIFPLEGFIYGNVDHSIEQFPQEYKIERVKLPDSNLFFRIIKYLYLTFNKKEDRHKIWIKRAVKRAQKLFRTNDYSLVLTFAQPWSDHIIGRIISELYNIPLVAHFSDPWVDNTYYPLKFREDAENIKQEKAIIENSAALIFTNEESMKLVMKKYDKEFESKAYVIPHGYDRNYLDHLNVKKTKVKKFEIVYTGSFYPGRRTPEEFLIALSLLNREYKLEELIKVYFVGPHIKEYEKLSAENNLGSVVFFTGRKSYLDSLQYIYNADLLILIESHESDGGIFLPSKVADYLMAKKIIFGIIPEPGPSASILRELNFPVVRPGNSEQIARELKKQIELWKNNELKVSHIADDYIKKYDYSNLIINLENILRIVQDNMAVASSDRSL